MNPRSFWEILIIVLMHMREDYLQNKVANKAIPVDKFPYIFGGYFNYRVIAAVPTGES